MPARAALVDGCQIVISLDSCWLHHALHRYRYNMVVVHKLKLLKINFNYGNQYFLQLIKRSAAGSLNEINSIDLVTLPT